MTFGFGSGYDLTFPVLEPHIGLCQNLLGMLPLPLSQNKLIIIKKNGHLKTRKLKRGVPGWHSVGRAYDLISELWVGHGAHLKKERKENWKG